MPATFGPNDFIGIRSNTHRIRMRLNPGDHLDIIEIRENKSRSIFQYLEAKPRVEIYHMSLDVRIERSIALHPRELDARAHKLKGKSSAAELLTDRQSLDFCKVSKISDANTTCRLVTDITQKMSPRYIVAIELFIVRALLFAHINCASHAYDAHQIVQSACYRDAQAIRAGTFPITVIEGWLLRGTPEFIKMRRNHAADCGTFSQAECLVVTNSFRRIWPRINVHPVIGRQSQPIHE